MFPPAREQVRPSGVTTVSVIDAVVRGPDSTRRPFRAFACQFHVRYGSASSVCVRRYRVGKPSSNALSHRARQCDALRVEFARQFAMAHQIRTP